MLGRSPGFSFCVVCPWRFSSRTRGRKETCYRNVAVSFHFESFDVYLLFFVSNYRTERPSSNYPNDNRRQAYRFSDHEVQALVS